MNATDYDDDGFVFIPKWMYRLDLTLAETAAYGIIYVFSQERQGCFFGSLEYLARYCRVSRRQAINILKKLEDAGLITREPHPGSTTHFYAVDNREALKLFPCNNFTRENISPLPCNNFTPPRENISPNNKDDIKEYNKDIPTSPRTRELVAYGEKVRMTSEEHAKLVAEYGEEDTAALCEILDDHMCAKGVTYKSHYRAIRKWCVDKLSERKLQQLRMKNAQEAAQRVNAQQPQKKAEGPDYADYYRQQQRWNELLNKGKQS
jgi:hypothetical protein